MESDHTSKPPDPTMSIDIDTPQWALQTLELYAKERINILDGVKTLSTNEIDDFDRFWSWLMNEAGSEGASDDETPLVKLSTRKNLKDEAREILEKAGYLEVRERKWWVAQLRDVSRQLKAARQGSKRKAAENEMEEFDEADVDDEGVEDICSDEELYKRKSASVATGRAGSHM